MKLLIVQTGATLPALLRRHGDFPEWFRRGLRVKPEHVDIVRVDAHEALPDARRFQAAVVTGSGAMVSERLDWSERTAAWLADAARAGLPLLGVCYGHQLLAHAFGGHVDYNPRGREIGTVDIHCLPAVAEDELMRGSPPRFRAHATHLQSVLRPPAGAAVLARSALDDCQAIRFAPRVWGLQFHPEFTVEHMRGYLHERSERVDAEGLDAKALTQAVGAAPHARSLLRRFVRIAAER
ncbi:MAG TPA: glutamine amidotransferase [Rudaea sp.]|nr:glutamine amidotransferase [Rudaea sp.]